MKKRYLQNLLSLLFLTFFSGSIFAQCTLFLTASDSSTCAGDSITLTAHPSGGSSSISTVWVSNNGGSAGGIVFYDLTVAGAAISINSMDINTSGTVGPISIAMYTRTGTYVGNTASSAGWTQVGTATGPTAAGTDLPTLVTFVSPVSLNASTTYGVALIMTTSHSWRYTNGTGGNQAFSNADLSLSLGAAGNVPWTTTFTPRVWNGTIHYSGPGGSLLWSTGDTTTTITVAPLSNTTYSCTLNVPSLPCSVSDSLAITVSGLPVVALGNDTAVCNPAVLNLDAGNPGSSFAWSIGDTTQTVSVSLSGNYSVEVTNPAGCAGADTIQLTFNDPPLVDLGNDTTLCSGESITLDAGNPGGSFNWSTGGSNQTELINTPPGGLITVEVTDANSCVASDSVSVVFDIISVSLGSDLSICDGTTAVLDAGSAGASYLWSDGATTQMDTVSAAGDYSVTVTSAFGCTGVDTVSISLTPNPVASFTASTVGTTTTFTNTSTNGTSYSWNFGDGGTSTLQSPTHDFADGSYTVTLIVTNACGSDTTTQNLTILAMDESSAGVLSIFPNPANEFLHIHFSAEGPGLIKVELMDIFGKIVFESQKTSNEYDEVIGLKDFSSGIYFVRVSMEGRSVFSKLIID